MIVPVVVRLLSLWAVVVKVEVGEEMMSGGVPLDPGGGNGMVGGGGGGSQVTVVMIWDGGPGSPCGEGDDQPGAASA